MTLRTNNTHVLNSTTGLAELTHEEWDATLNRLRALRWVRAAERLLGTRHWNRLSNEHRAAAARHLWHLEEG